ncbi:MAG: LLM class flavin-dependent oxidoreductase [Chloroflexi bacterium]|nr:LLM class flavin-dependent oxidoreductase [Chloroflexota bacterium]
MQFGIFSNSRRPERLLHDAWDQDLAEIVLADELGIEEAWISEHVSPAELIICKAAALTSRIKLGSAVRPLAYHHPLQVAIEANACDNLTHGRYQLGIGTGFGGSYMDQRGLDDAERRDMLHAAMDLILRLWEAREPFDYDGPYWSGRGLELKQPSVQKPHPPVAIAALHSLDSVEWAGSAGFKLLTGDFNPPHRLREFGEVLEEVSARAGNPSGRANFAVTRVIYVAASDAQAREELRDSYDKTIRWEIANTPWHQAERVPPGGALDDITYDYLVDSRNLFVGSPDTVFDCISELYAQTGGFGTLMMHAGRDYASWEQRERSMRMFMTEVAPRLRAWPPKMAAAAAA